jgi:NAD(P)H-hydrate epimerase
MVTPQEMQALEKRAFAAGASAEALMEEAGRRMAQAVRQFCPLPGRCTAVFGKGHNGGDALVAARFLSEAGWQVELVPAYPAAEWAPLTARKWDQAGRCSTLPQEDFARWQPEPATPCVLLDGVLGVGARPGLPEPVARLSRRLNALRESSAARTFALDLPTGLDGASGKADPDAVVADVTLTVGFVKSGLLADGAERWVGRLALLPLEMLNRFAPEQPPLELATPEALLPFWPRRPADLHKGDCGRVTLLAGAAGTLGAAVLAARGALRAGAGLVTLCVPEALHGPASALAPPECMVQPVRDPREALDFRADALGIGPGLGRSRPEAVEEVIRAAPCAAVVDADALNILADGRLDALARCAAPRLLTPHPGEMARLAPELQGLERRVAVQCFTERWPVSLLLKGARTLVGTGGAHISYNTTGTPAMASGGMGDVLTGVCAALLARGLPPHTAGLLGAWLCGRSAEAALSSGLRSEESLLATDVADGLGAAFAALRQASV